MSDREAVRFECEMHHATMVVEDVAAAVDFYVDRLGFSLDFTWEEPPSFAGVSLDRVQVFLELDGSRAGTAAAYFLVGDADEMFEFHRGNGVTSSRSPVTVRTGSATTPSGISTATG